MNLVDDCGGVEGLCTMRLTTVFFLFFSFLFGILQYST